jgi:arsenical pump membrane protein
VVAGLAAGLDGHAALDALRQDWPAFVLVTGLLLIGRVARRDGLFDLAGELVSRVGRGGVALLVCSATLVALVTVTLNLDTSVTFVTPVVIAAARRQRRDVEPFAYLVLAMSNAASLLLPGSNLTNLIVLGETHGSGGAFVRTLAAPWAASVVATLLAIAVLFGRRVTRSDPGASSEPHTRRVGWSALAIAAAVVAMVTLSSGTAALSVLGLGLALLALDLVLGQLPASVGDLNVPLLVGLLGLACALGTLGRAWSGPTHLLTHLDAWAGAAVGAGASVAVNNLPAASLLAARPPAHAAALLVGLNLGPNLALWASLAGVLWFQSARTAGWTPSVRRCSYLGLVIVPVTMAASLGALALAH